MMPSRSLGVAAAHATCKKNSKRRFIVAKNGEIQNIAIVGTGVIGASWAALYLARGFKVVATDPGPNAEANLRKYIDDAWKELAVIGLSPNASRDNLEFTLDMKKALANADLVQENGPERKDFKIKLFADMDAATPPHAIPLVEVVAGEKTSSETVERAISFYKSIGKKPIHVRKEVVGHVANRLQAALYREVVYLIEQGVLDVADSDVAVCWGPGLRWGVMGPNLLFHLGGGQDGIKHFMAHLGPALATWWKDLGTITEFSPQVTKTIIDGVQQEAAGRSIDELAEERDKVLLGLLALRSETSSEAKSEPKQEEVFSH